MPDIHACPVCGKAPKLHGLRQGVHNGEIYYVICPFCNIKTPNYTNRKDAVGYWNNPITRRLMKQVLEFPRLPGEHLHAGSGI